jgi:phage terminase small subunit
MTQLTPKQQKFVEEYLIDLNATQAAIRAGYSETSAGVIGCENLTKPYIQAAIADRRREMMEKTGVTPERVIEELAKLGFANMQDFLKVTSDGDPHFDLSELTREQAAALAEVTVEDFKDGRGEDARDVRRIKFKLADKRSALVDIGKHMGMFKDRTDVNLTITHESALEQLDDAPDANGDDAEGKGTPASAS